MKQVESPDVSETLNSSIFLKWVLSREIVNTEMPREDMSSP